MTLPTLPSERCFSTKTSIITDKMILKNNEPQHTTTTVVQIATVFPCCQRMNLTSGQDGDILPPWDSARFPYN